MKLDEAPVVLPVSFATRIDLLTAWGDSPTRSQLARIDWLVGQGVAPTAIYKRGPLLVGAISDSIPTEAEVDDAAAGFPDGEALTK